jgi:3D (Asp-Asp-Asp) domain-containing protein
VPSNPSTAIPARRNAPRYRGLFRLVRKPVAWLTLPLAVVAGASIVASTTKAMKPSSDRPPDGLTALPPFAVLASVVGPQLPPPASVERARLAKFRSLGDLGAAPLPPLAPRPFRARPAASPPKLLLKSTASTPPGGARYLGNFVVTCYDLGGGTASGAPVGLQTVAVDPSVIPLGTHIYVDGAGPRIAEDTGGAIRGDRLDIWEPTYPQCAAWGVQTRQVWLAA